MLKKTASGILLLLTITSLPLNAGYISENLSPNTDTTTNFLEQVVITGTRTPHALKNVPVLTKVVSKIELNDIGAVTALDALESLMPGFTFNPDQNHGDNIQLQGLDNKYVLVLLNGERMVNGRSENVNFARINAADIQRIEIIDGAASVLYGSNAIGAVINIITKDVQEALEINLAGRYGSYNSYVGDAALGLSGDNWSSRTVFNTKGSDGYLVKGTTAQGNPASRRVNPSDDYYIGETFKYRFSDKLKADLYGSAYLSQFWPYQDVIHRRETDYNAGAHVYWQTATDNMLCVALNSDFYNAYTLENQSNKELFHNNYNLTSGRITDTWTRLSRLRLIGGYEFNHEYANAPERFGSGSAVHSAYDNNLFVQGEFKLWDNLSVVAGGRLTQHSSFGIHFTPKLSVMYSVGDFRFRAGVSNGFKAPSLKEMYYNFNMPGGFYMKGNPDLKPESSWYESLSAEYIAQQFNISVTVYNNDINNRIAYVEYNGIPEYPSGLLHYANVERAGIRGVDVAARANFCNYFNVTANYSFADTEDKGTGNALNGTSKHAFTGGIAFRYPDCKIGLKRLPMSLYFSGRVASPRLYQNVNQLGIPKGSETKTTSIWRMVYTQEIPYVWMLSGIEIQAGIDNLFDWTDPIVAATPGRTWFVTLKLNI